MLTFLQGVMLWILAVAAILRWFRVASYTRDEVELGAGPEPEFDHLCPHARRMRRAAELFVPVTARERPPAKTGGRVQHEFHQVQ